MSILTDQFEQIIQLEAKNTELKARAEKAESSLAALEADRERLVVALKAYHKSAACSQINANQVGCGEAYRMAEELLAHHTASSAQQGEKVEGSGL